MLILWREKSEERKKLFKMATATAEKRVGMKEERPRIT